MAQRKRISADAALASDNAKAGTVGAASPQEYTVFDTHADPGRWIYLIAGPFPESGLDAEQTAYIVAQHNDALKRCRAQAPAHAPGILRPSRASNLPDPALRACYADPIPGSTKAEKYLRLIQQLRECERVLDYQRKENAAGRARKEKAEADKNRSHSVGGNHAKIGGQGRSPPQPTAADDPILRFHQDTVPDRVPRTAPSTREWAGTD